MRILINETQLKNIIKEAIPYNIAKEYITTERTDGAIKRMDDVFDKLKNLPNAKVLDRRGHRIALPYGETPLEDDIKMLLRKYDYNILDFNNNEALRISKTEKGNKVQPIKITKALANISRLKDKDGNIIEPNAKDFVDIFADGKSREGKAMTKKLGLIVIFARHPYDIAGMSYGRTWRSCMHLVDGELREFVKKDIKFGTIAVYLTKANDVTLSNPLARVLVKPYINLKNINDVILYPEAKTYGKIDNPKKFIDYLDYVLEKIQNMGEEYKLLSCLNPDSKREVVRPKNNKTREDVLYKLENGDKLNNVELKLLTKEEAENYVAKQISMYFKWNARLSGNNLDDLALTEEEILIATDNQLDDYFEQRLDDFEGTIMDKVFAERYVAIDDFELRFMSNKQMTRYVDILHAAEAKRRSYTL
jgi:hypothetical protein